MLFSKSKYHAETSDLVEFSAITVLLLLSLLFGLSKTIKMDVEIDVFSVDAPLVAEPPVVIDVPKEKPGYVVPRSMDEFEEEEGSEGFIEYVQEPYVPSDPPLLTFKGNLEVPEDEVIAFINVQEPPKLSISEKEKLLGLITENYPLLAKKSGTEGKVKLSFVCSKEGRPVNIEITSEAPEGLGFGEAAVSALKLVRFSPGYQNDKPVAVKMSQTIGFGLKK